MSDTLEVMNKVNAFYQMAWTNLLWFTGALFAILGIFIPLVIQYLQSRTFSRDKKAHMEYLSTEVVSAKEELKAHFATQMKDLETKAAKDIEQIKNELTTMIKSETAIALGGVFLLQANMAKNDRRNAEAARDFAIAATKWLKADPPDMVNARRAISGVIKALSRSDKSEFEAAQGVEAPINDLIQVLDRPENNVFSDDVSSIKKELKDCLDRTPPTAMPQPPASH